MSIISLQAILATATEALPRLFLFGAPVLLIAIAAAAFVDATIPWGADHAAPVRSLARRPARR